MRKLVSLTIYLQKAYKRGMCALYHSTMVSALKECFFVCFVWPLFYYISFNKKSNHSRVTGALGQNLVAAQPTLKPSALAAS